MRKLFLIILLFFYYFKIYRCESCKVSYCKSCDSSFTSNCNQCQDGYYLYHSDYEDYCYICKDGCKICVSKYDNCTSCNNNYILDNHTCTYNQSATNQDTSENSTDCYAQNCKTCWGNSSYICDVCQDSYYLYTNNQCQECDYRCLTCTQSTCLSCISGYYLQKQSCYSLFTSSCSVWGCANCSISDLNTCLNCQTSYSLNQGSCDEEDKSFAEKYVYLLVVIPLSIIIIGFVIRYLCRVKQGKKKTFNEIKEIVQASAAQRENTQFISESCNFQQPEFLIQQYAIWANQLQPQPNPYNINQVEQQGFNYPKQLPPINPNNTFMNETNFNMYQNQEPITYINPPQVAEDNE